jgi:Zn-dependent protease
MSEQTPIPGGDAGGGEPLEITTFYPQQVTALDTRRRRVSDSYNPRRSFRTNRPLAIVLFAATCISVFLAGLMPGSGFLLAAGVLEGAWKKGLLWPVWQVMFADGAIYFGALMTILFAHEMGHFLQAKRYGIPANGPYFIPFPIISPFGTMGAVIIQGAGVADRKSMFDIAISGPLAGLVFAVPITAIGIAKSHFVPTGPGAMIFHDPLLIQLMSRWIHGGVPANYELTLNAWLFAGWVGIFITALNLMPIGQLDGGHILYTLIGRRAHGVAISLLVAAIAYMIFERQPSYALMILLLIVAGPRHPPTADDNVPLGAGRILLGWLTLGFLILGFTPRPIDLVPGMEMEQRPPAQQKQEPEPKDSGDAVEVRNLPKTKRRAAISQLATGSNVTKTWSNVDQEIANLVNAEPRIRELG